MLTYLTLASSGFGFVYAMSLLSDAARSPGESPIRNWFRRGWQL